MLVRLKAKGKEGAVPQNLVDYSFIIKGKAERERKPPSSSVLSRCQASIISSSLHVRIGEFSHPCCDQSGTVSAMEMRKKKVVTYAKDGKSSQVLV